LLEEAFSASGKKEQTFEDSDSSGEVVHPAGGAQGSRKNLNRGNKVVGEGVVQVALYRKQIISSCHDRR